MKPHIFHPAARQEYVQAVQYYANIESNLADRFYDEIEALLLEVCREPKRFFKFSPPARRALSQEFPYSVIYLEQPDRIWILAVMHAKRKLGYWRQRLRG